MTFSIDDRLGLIPPLSWLVTDSPVISAILLFLVTPGGLWIVRLIGGRILLPSDELKATKAHIYFPLLLACNVALINSANGGPINGYLSGAIQGLSFAGVFSFMLPYYLTHPMMGMKGRRSSLTFLYYLVACAAVAPTLILTTVVGFIDGEWSFGYLVVRAVVVWCLLKFAWGFIDDITEEVTTGEGFTRIQMAHNDHSYPWQWMSRSGHWKWWWTRFRAGIGGELKAMYIRR